MEEIPRSEAPIDPPRRRRPDVVSAVMVVVTLLLLAGTAWHRFGPAAAPEPLEIGSESPELGLIDIQTGEPIVLLGLRGKVVWLTFWTSSDERVRKTMPRLNAAWKGLKGRSSFAMLSATLASDDRALTRKIAADDQLELPIYQANSETCRRFEVAQGTLPLHVVIDTDGRVLVISRRSDEEAIAQLETVVRARLETLDPGSVPRFAEEPRLRTDVVARETER